MILVVSTAFLTVFMSATTTLCRELASSLRASDISMSDAHEMRTAIKMYVFIMSWIACEEEADAVKASQQTMPVATVHSN